MTDGRHPIGRQFDVGQLLDVGGGNVGDGFADSYRGRRPGR